LNPCIDGTVYSAAGRTFYRRAAPVKSLLNWVLLGLVIEKPSYIYEVCQRLERRFGQVLPVSRARVYDAFRALEDRGFIEELDDALVVLSGTPRQPKLHYQATPAGVREHRRWLVGQIAEEGDPPALVSRLIAASALDDRTLMVILDQYEQECLDQARNLPSEAHDDSPLAQGERIAAELRRATLHAHLGWIAWARQDMKDRESRRRSEGTADGGDESAVA
jgi:DNA-binding PadR family transcriptional regulator